MNHSGKITKKAVPVPWLREFKKIILLIVFESQICYRLQYLLVLLHPHHEIIKIPYFARDVEDLVFTDFDTLISFLDLIQMKPQETQRMDFRLVGSHKTESRAAFYLSNISTINEVYCLDVL